MPTRGALYNPQPCFANFTSCMYDIAGANAAHPLSPGCELHPENVTKAADTGIGESRAVILSYIKFRVDVCSYY